MDIKTQLNESMKDALRSGDVLRKNTVRMVLAAIKQAEVDKQITLEDMAVIALLQKEIKNRKEAIDEAKTASRDDLVDENEAEIVVLEVFLPEALSANELREIVTVAISEVSATSVTDMGAVMKVAQAKVAGRAPGGDVSALVKELLNS
ncbi:MAG: GatB/YqeY domain-containing protein [Anaerolineae bacterium]|nr:GatB/YqeY domain-containing protein [Anaerolineae bacterium]MDK1079840.1 GatB/YqeY domain-containing protein [Anaerolineae bacterium]MDK1119063.1 GatB/YqeY domain-containing protein [Anaerolineae bacterium]